MMTLPEALRDQARSCEILGSPFTARLLRLAADRLTPGTPVADRLFAWEGDISSRGHSLSLRLAGALHALVRSGRDPALAAIYAAPDGASDDALWQAVAEALAAHEGFVMDWLDSPPQTNEVRRSAVLIAGAAWLTARTGLPLALSELGASAGLNLIFDRYALTAGPICIAPPDPVLTLAPDWQGAAPPEALLRVADRRGVDLNPLDPQADRLRLMSYIWADQTDRLTRTEAALAEAARIVPRVDRGDAAGWLEDRLSTPLPGHLHLIFHTIAWQYFPQATKDRASTALGAAGARATAQAPIAHLAMEADDQTPGAGIALTLWTGGTPERIQLGRADFHGRWIDWQAPAP